MERFPLAALSAVLVMTFAAAPAPAEAQFWEKVKDAAGEAVEDETADQVDRLMREAVRCTFDNLECIEAAERDGEPVVLTERDGTVLTDEEGVPVTDRDQLPADRRAAGGPSTGPVGDNYDFEAGGRTIFAEDFSADNVGDFPRRLEFLKGNMEVVDWDGRRWLRARSSSAFAVALGEQLPDRFTIEFDVHFAGGGSNGVTVLTTEGRRSAHYHEHNYFRIGHRHQTGVAAGGRADGAPSSLAASDAMHGATATARVMVDGDYAKVYVNRARVANVPNADLPRSERLWFFVPGSDESPTFITNLRVAAGGKDLYEALSAEGRVAVQDILFDTNSAEIQPASADVLAEIAGMLAERPGLKLLVEGHTDDQGGFQHNMKLSGERAAAVKAYLVERHGVAAERLETIGLGPTQPVASNDAGAGRAENRRVELVRIDGD